MARKKRSPATPAEPRIKPNPLCKGHVEVRFNILGTATVTLPERPPGTPDWLRGEVVPLTKIQGRYTSIEHLSDFNEEYDEVRRHDGRVYVVDTRGYLAPQEVAPREITEFPRFVANVEAETDPGKLTTWAHRIACAAVLSEEGQQERLEVIRRRVAILTGRISFTVDAEQSRKLMQKLATEPMSEE
jgi:hypothetical protein